MKLSRAIQFLLFALIALRGGAAEIIPFQFTTNGSAITITRYTGTNGNVFIPESIDDLPVTTIAADAFFRNRALTSVTIPKTIASIEQRRFDLATAVFAGCENLVSIAVDPLNPAYASVDGVLLDKSQTNVLACPKGKTGSYAIPATVTRVADRAFVDCRHLTSVTLPDSLARIGNGAFAGCHGLTSITIPSQITWLGSETFAGCARLTNVTISGPLTRIEDGAFSGCRSLTAITIPVTVTALGDWAFSGCETLTQVTIPANVTSIGLRVFAGCAKLEAITVDPPNPGYRSLDGVLFDHAGTTLLVYPEGKTGAYTIPEGVTRIKGGAFAGCAKLTGIVIPASVTSLGERAFADCAALTAITIPGGITNIPSAAFEGCAGLTNVTLSTSVTSIEGGAFAGCTSLVGLALPNSLTHIGDTAFSECGHLTKVTTPENVIRIETGAFQNCTNLTTATIRGNLANLGNGPFYNCGNLQGVYFERDAPGGLVATSPFAFFQAQQATVYFLPERAGWEATFGGRPTAPWLPRMENPNWGFAEANQFGFTLTWASGRQVVIEASPSLTIPAWSPVGTNLLAEGNSFFGISTGPESPNRFFRLRAQ